MALKASLRIFFGGTFDPPHSAHFELPHRVREELDSPDAWLIYVPAAQSPHKDIAPTPDHHRVAMLEIALGNRERCVIWDTELARTQYHPDKPSFWADTWDTVNAAGSLGDNRFLIGADQALAMHRWHRFESIWRDAIVMMRDEHEAPRQLIEALAETGAWDQEQLAHWRASIVRVPMIDASSTHIRAMLRDPETRKNPIATLDDRVHQYILEHSLY